MLSTHYYYREVLRGCLHIDPAERLTADELLGMEWFKVLDVTELDHAVEVRDTEHAHLQMIVCYSTSVGAQLHTFLFDIVVSHCSHLLQCNRCNHAPGARILLLTTMTFVVTCFHLVSP
jgi:hypothetical protein